MMYRLRPVTDVDLSPAERRHPLTSEVLREIRDTEGALQRWEGEGGAPHDAFGVLDELKQRQEAIELSRRTRATWPGWTSGPNGKLTPPPRATRNDGDFTDQTDPVSRTFGYYLVKVPARQYSQLIRASHPTAARVARSRTQYGDAELHFLGAIDTPALD